MITSKDNEKLKLVRALASRSRRRKEGLFVTEGEDLLEAGLSAGHRPEFVLVAAGSGIDGEEVEPSLLATASNLGSGSRAIAVWQQTWQPVDAVEPAGGDRERAVWIYLDRVGDPGNVGTIIRSAQALVDGIVVAGPDTADPFSPKAVRASMGAIFHQPVTSGGIGDTPEPRLAMVAHGGRPLEDNVGALAGTDGPVTICLGAEREGLAPVTLAACSDLRTIRLRETAVESLNVAAAAAIILARVAATRAETTTSPERDD